MYKSSAWPADTRGIQQECTVPIWFGVYLCAVYDQGRQIYMQVHLSKLNEPAAPHLLYWLHSPLIFSLFADFIKLFVFLNFFM